jgi:hypothetical protein
MRGDRARRALVLMLVALGVAAGGCSGDKTAEYKQDAKAIIDPLRGTLASTSERVAAARSLDARIAALDATRQAVDTAAAKLSKLDPPSDAKAQHEAFVRELERFGSDIRAFEHAARAGDSKGAQRSQAQLRADTTRLKDANDALRAKVD